MSPKEELRQIYFIDKEIVSIEDQIETVRCKLEKVTPILSHTSGTGGDTDKMTNGVTKLIELKELLNKKIDKACDYRIECLKKIDLIQDGVYRVILKERYLNNKNLWEIRETINYSYPRVKQLHGLALLEYEKISHNYPLKSDNV